MTFSLESCAQAAEQPVLCNHNSEVERALNQVLLQRAGIYVSALEGVTYHTKKGKSAPRTSSFTILQCVGSRLSYCLMLFPSYKDYQPSVNGKNKIFSENAPKQNFPILYLFSIKIIFFSK